MLIVTIRIVILILIVIMRILVAVAITITILIVIISNHTISISIHNNNTAARRSIEAPPGGPPGAGAPWLRRGSLIEDSSVEPIVRAEGTRRTYFGPSASDLKLQAGKQCRREPSQAQLNCARASPIATEWLRAS